MRSIEKKTKNMLEIESEMGESIEEILRHMFVDLHLPHRVIAKELGVGYETVIKWLRMSGIYSRKLNI